MELVKKSVMGKEFIFTNESINTRNGFAHVTTLFEDEREIATSRCNYINRTWECYRFQSSMRRAVANAIEKRKKSLEYGWRYENNGKRFTAKIKAELFGQDKRITDLQELAKIL